MIDQWEKDSSVGLALIWLFKEQPRSVYRQGMLFINYHFSLKRLTIVGMRIYHSIHCRDVVI